MRRIVSKSWRGSIRPARVLSDVHRRRVTSARRISKTRPERRSRMRAPPGSFCHCLRNESWAKRRRGDRSGHPPRPLTRGLRGSNTLNACRTRSPSPSRSKAGTSSSSRRCRLPAPPSGSRPGRWARKRSRKRAEATRRRRCTRGSMHRVTRIRPCCSLRGCRSRPCLPD